jgi:hypothetical protein
MIYHILPKMITKMCGDRYKMMKLYFYTRLFEDLE